MPDKYAREITNNPSMQSEYDIVGCIKRFSSDHMLSQKPLVVLPYNHKYVSPAVPQNKVSRRSKKNDKREMWRKLADACPSFNIATIIDRSKSPTLSPPPLPPPPPTPPPPPPPLPPTLPPPSQPSPPQPPPCQHLLLSCSRPSSNKPATTPQRTQQSPRPTGL
jgi:hypothetical protein